MATVVSAPGKVLIAGGYLVLDPIYSGIVVSASSRFYTVIADTDSLGANNIQVRSPQFEDATWKYVISVTDKTVTVEEHPDNTSKNKFVFLALKKTLSLAHELVGADSLGETLAKGLDIAIVGDNDFYSQRAKLESLNLPRTLKSLESIEPFVATGVKLSEVHKTGMGSSASLITSLVSALLLHTKTIPTESFSDVDTDGRRLAHNLAQYVHCLAQGKVGSGFDVSAAVFGSHLYTRFEPDVLKELMNDDAPTPALYPILSPTNAAWNYRIDPFQLPPLTRIMLADVDAGSDTPSLVGKVLKWRKDESEQAKSVWTTLNQSNQSLAVTLKQLSKLYEADKENYTNAVRRISSLVHEQWSGNLQVPNGEGPILKAFFEVHTISESIRAQMREMGNVAGVPIEPEGQTKLLDACISLPGIIGGGVPGAGGYDAVWLLALDPVDASPDLRPVERVELVWANYPGVSPLSASESLAKGSRIEKLDEVKGLRQATLRA